MIKRIAQTAGFAGLLAALLLTLLQILWVTPLILEAETYEKSEPVAAQPHEHAPGVAAHVHDEEAWEPEDGWQRTLSTTAATAVGLALLVFGGNWPLKLVGAVLLALPHLFGAPQPEVHASLAPEALAQRFVVASLVSNALFWAALGLAAAWLFRRNRGGVDA